MSYFDLKNSPENSEIKTPVIIIIPPIYWIKPRTSPRMKKAKITANTCSELYIIPAVTGEVYF